MRNQELTQETGLEKVKAEWSSKPAEKKSFMEELWTKNKQMKAELETAQQRIASLEQENRLLQQQNALLNEKQQLSSERYRQLYLRLYEEDEDLSEQQELILRCQQLQNQKREWLEGEQNRMLELQRQKQLAIMALDNIKSEEVSRKEAELREKCKSIEYYQFVLRGKQKWGDELQEKNRELEEQKQQMSHTLYDMSSAVIDKGEVPLSHKALLERIKQMRSILLRLCHCFHLKLQTQSFWGLAQRVQDLQASADDLQTSVATLEQYQRDLERSFREG